MKRFLYFLIIIAAATAITKAQGKVFGKIHITEEKDIATLVADTTQHLQGYRIQIFTGNASEREKAQKIKDFVEKNFEIKAYVDYESPLFKVRVGNFIDKLEATALKQKLKKHYNNAYIIQANEIEF